MTLVAFKTHGENQFSLEYGNCPPRWAPSPGPRAQRLSLPRGPASPVAPAPGLSEEPVGRLPPCPVLPYCPRRQQGRLPQSLSSQCRSSLQSGGSRTTLGASRGPGLPRAADPATATLRQGRTLPALLGSLPSSGLPDSQGQLG
ncbi:hypothetical protein GHT09_000672 [Marmota monax]|uniref:Uncharacterized protein n=1 Tax=Marmota monax TaxID=9995 RepID=A0A834R3T8_MARMO|nr:hypothetical protein GHT09_000672 [Marmota monax]